MNRVEVRRLNQFFRVLSFFLWQEMRSVLLLIRDPMNRAEPSVRGAMKKPVSYKIRNAGFDDVPAIYALIKEHPEELLPRSVSDIVQNIDRFIVCEAKNRVIGTAAWEILPELGKVSDPSIEIKSVAVAGSFHRKGVGTVMVKELIDRVKAFDPARLVVLTFTPGFFRKFGFVEVPKETLMHKLYAGCVNCTKYDSPFTCPEVAMILSIRPRKK